MVKIDEKKCIGCGVCVNVCPTGFAMNNSHAVLKDPAVDCIKDAAAACPVQAITIGGTNVDDNKSPVKSNSLNRNNEPFSNTGRGQNQTFGSGRGAGGGMGSGSFGGGRGRNQGSGLGQGGYCICPSCGHKESHQRGVPCYETHCPKCNSIMRRV